MGDKREHGPFFKAISTSGGLISTYEFETDAEADSWMSKEAKELEKRYGKLSFRRFDLPGLKIGDSCSVWGEGPDEFKIVGLKRYSEHRYGFVLDSGWCEEAYKCKITEGATEKFDDSNKFRKV